MINDLAVPIVFYTDRLSVKPAPITVTWADFVQTFTDDACIEASPCTVAAGPNRCKGKDCPYKSHSSLPPDEDGPNPMAWSPVQITGNRLDKNVTALTLLVLDFDGLADDQYRYVTGALAPYEHVRHTTHSHRSDSSCFRAVLALTRPVPANQWHRFLAAAIDFLGVTVVTTNKKGEQVRQPDRICKDRARLYYRPSHPSDAPHDAQYTEGKLLDVDAVLARAPAAPLSVSTAPATPLPTASPWNLDGDHVDEILLLGEEYFPDSRRNEFCLALAGMLRRAGATQEDATYIVREIARRGGSDDPDKRALTVQHTYGLLDDDAAMTGFTRVSEIIGEEAAKKLGDEITDASNESFLTRQRARAAADKAIGANAGGAATTNGASAVPAPPAPIDVPALRASVRSAAMRKMASDDRDDKINAIILRRALAGEALGVPGGVGDVETVREGAAAGVDAEEAVRLVAGTLAFAFPSGTSWEGAAEVLRASLSCMDPKLARCAERAYVSAQIARMKREEAAAAEQAAQQERLRANLLAQAGGAAPPSGDPPDGPDWEDLIIKKQGDGSIAQTLHNARVILRNHPEFCGTFRWNEVTKRIDVRGLLGRLTRFGLDNIVAAVQDRLSSVFALNVAHRDLVRRVVTIARENPYDPLRDFLLSLVWDGIPRLFHWMKRYCGAIETPENAHFLELVSRRWPVALVARGIDPGCKVDNVLVIGGPGGLGKSTVFSILGGKWFCDSPIHIGDKDSQMLAGQYWICEMAELVSFRRGGHDKLKAFFSSSTDKFRPPYGADLEESPRRAVFVGTVNDDTYLGDETGNRKYLTVDCEYTESGLEALRRDREQILAEAVFMYLAAETCKHCTKHDRCKVHRWHFAYDEIAITEAEADKRLVETPIKLAISEWWYSLGKHERPRCVTTLEAYRAAFESKGEKVPDSDLQRVGYALKKMGFLRKRDTTGARHWRYYPTQELLEADKVKRGNYVSIPGKPKDPVLPS